MFAQRSTDHRGTPEAPGLVATIVENAVLQDLPGAHANDRTLGRAFIVPDDQSKEVLAELDFREKGGYTRQVVDVEKLADGSSVKALLYSGTTDNPNFWWGDDGRGLDLDAAAAIIATAVGPSGPNVEYLQNLAQWLEEAGQVDDHVASLKSRIEGGAGGQ